MTAKEAILLNLSETRKRTLLIFDAIPEDQAHWKPDEDALSLIQTVRHIYECDDWFRQIILHDLKAEEFMPDWDSLPYSTVQHEISYGTTYRELFLDTISSFTDEGLSTKMIVRPKWTKTLGEFLVRCAYHETYHAGQLQFFLRMIDAPRAQVWL